MPRFSEYTDIYVNVDAFLDKCDEDEIKEVIEWLRDSDYITSDDLLDDDSPQSALQQLYEENIAKIRAAYLQISKEDFEAINRIAKKY
jgi:DNA-binding MurR/RpiR family transcriptional regulator